MNTIKIKPYDISEDSRACGLIDAIVREQGYQDIQVNNFEMYGDITLFNNINNEVNDRLYRLYDTNTHAMSEPVDRFIEFILSVVNYSINILGIYLLDLSGIVFVEYKT